MNEPLYLTPAELSARYKSRITMRTLANWRALRQGPGFVKIGGRVLYPLARVIEWENTRAHGQPQPEPSAA